MTKIVAGYWFDEKIGRKEYIVAHLPLRMFIYCKWCGNLASKKMYLIKTEQDMIPLEKQYSSVCTCGGRHE